MNDDESGDGGTVDAPVLGTGAERHGGSSPPPRTDEPANLDNMTAIELVQIIGSVYGCNVDEKEAQAILWEHTGFPGFWRIPEDGATPGECMRKQLHAFFGQERSDG